MESYNEHTTSGNKCDHVQKIRTSTKKIHFIFFFLIPVLLALVMCIISFILHEVDSNHNIKEY